MVHIYSTYIYSPGIFYTRKVIKPVLPVEMV